MEIWVVVLGVLMVVGAIAVLFQRSLRNSIITFGIISLMSALIMAMMKAYDVAITEASIGAVLTTAIFFWSLKRVEEDGYDEKK
jgi:energy-converting hydrogenase B subunit D